MLPYIAVIMLILILITALQFGLSTVYLTRIKIRDALDSAVLSAASIAEIQQKPTYYGEKREKKDDGTYTWVKTTSGYTDYITLSENDAREIAEEYLKKNMSMSNIKNWKIVSLDVKITYNSNIVQVHKHRPHTEGTITSWESNFPQWVIASATAKVDVPAPMGGILGKDRMIVSVYSQSKKQVNPVNIGSGGWE